MKKLFIHHPLYRLLSPIFVGIVVYLLILLVNNNIEQLQENFLGQELYFCIGLSYLTQEFARLLLMLFNKLGSGSGNWLGLLGKVVAALVLTAILVTGAVYLYYQQILGFSPGMAELKLFNIIFGMITLISISLFLSHQFLFEINTKRIEKELQRKAGLEADFIQFQRGINPELLFESLESLIVLLRADEEQADAFLDRLAVVYRYILSRKREEIVPLEIELVPLNELVNLFDELPYRSPKLKVAQGLSSHVLPGSLLAIVEKIIRSTIPAPGLELDLLLEEDEEHLTLSYESHERVIKPFDLEDLKSVQESYSVYSSGDVYMKTQDHRKVIGIPKLNLEAESV